MVELGEVSDGVPWIVAVTVSHCFSQRMKIEQSNAEDSVPFSTTNIETKRYNLIQIMVELGKPST